MYFTPRFFALFSTICASVIASPSPKNPAPRSPPGGPGTSVCQQGQMGVGQETDYYSGTYATIWDNDCEQMDFTSARVEDICGSYVFGSEVKCDANGVVTGIATSLVGSTDGTQLTMFGDCSPAPAGANCNRTFGLSLDTSITFCCSQS